MPVLAGFLTIFGMVGAAVALVMLIVQIFLKRGWPKKRIWTVGAISLALFVVGMVMGVSSVPEGYEAWQKGYEAGRQAAEENDEKELNAPQTPSEDNQMKYEIVAKNDISFGVAKRFEFRVVVPSSADKAYLENVAKDIIGREAPLNAAVFFFYDREEDSDGLYTIGKVTWAPYGDWTRASEMETGDYSKHQMVIEVKEKSAVPTEELAIHDEIKQILKGPGNPYTENPPAGEDVKEWMAKQSAKIAQWEENAFETVAKKYNITPQEAKEIYLRVEMR